MIKNNQILSKNAIKMGTLKQPVTYTYLIVTLEIRKIESNVSYLICNLSILIANSLNVSFGFFFL
jgi:hypothetical protein